MIIYGISSSVQIYALDHLISSHVVGLYLIAPEPDFLEGNQVQSHELGNPCLPYPHTEYQSLICWPVKRYQEFMFIRVRQTIDRKYMNMWNLGSSVLDMFIRPCTWGNEWVYVQLWTTYAYQGSEIWYLWTTRYRLWSVNVHIVFIQWLRVPSLLEVLWQEQT